MIINSSQDLVTYQKAADLSLRVLQELKAAVKTGILPIEVDNLAKKLCQEYHVRPSFLGVAGRQGLFPHATCICANDSVVHGIPSSTEKFKPGDTVKVDFGLVYENFLPTIASPRLSASLILKPSFWLKPLKKRFSRPPCRQLPALIPETWATPCTRLP